MARQTNILSFDDARRDVRARPSASASRRSALEFDDVPAFESPFRQPAASTRGSSSKTRRQSAPARSARASSSGTFSSFEETSEDRAFRHARANDSAQGGSRRKESRESRKRARAKEKAGRAFSKQFGGLNEPAAAQGGPRAAVYKGEMGAKHRKATRMQNTTHSASAKRGSSGRLAALKTSTKFIASAAVVACLALSCVFLYPAAQQYYQATREHDRLEAEYAAVAARTQAIQGDVDALQTDEGIEDIARAQMGWVKEGEQTANVRGLDLPEDGFTLRANIQPGSVEMPETWYSPILDPLFGVE